MDSLSSDESASAVALVNALNSLPPSENRYLALANYIEDKANSASNVNKAKPVFWILLAGQGTMLILAVWVITLRVCSRKFTFGTITRSKIMRLNPPDCFAVCCLFASPITIYSALTRIGYNASTNRFGTNAVVVQAIAFLFFWLPTWGFLWSWYGTIICNRWEPPWSQLSSIPGGRVPKAIVITLNSLIILGAVAATSGFLTVAAIFNKKIGAAIDILERLQESLKSVAPTYDPNTWQITMLLPFLQPLRDLREMTGGLTKAFQMTILTSLILVVTLVALYPFLIANVFMQRRRHIKNNINTEQSIKMRMKIDYVKELNSLLWVSLAIWLAFALYAPILIWQFVEVKEHPRNLTIVPVVILIVSLGLAAIFGNFILFVTLSQTYRLQMNVNGWQSLLQKAIKASSSIKVHSNKEEVSCTTSKGNNKIPSICVQTVTIQSSPLVTITDERGYNLPSA
ncbi:expressed protein [Phakopsora pachyrhizi]|uniref:Expressed protein n=1 Tax=Phakopsora pachyrhizi TaxID=170000 RepID=A0AAV0BD46_PHAPC|nr:expressed protein [Phakopsora pachyrhizi]